MTKEEAFVLYNGGRAMRVSPRPGHILWSRKPRAASMVLLCLRLMANCPASAGLDCVNLPPIPFHGKFSLSGWFQVTLRCPQDDMDLALNSPGDHGVMTCDPHSSFNYDLEELREPQCHRRVLPHNISLPVLIAYTVGSCSGETLRQTLSQIKSVLEEVFMRQEDPCGLQQRPCLAQLGHTCGENLAFPISPRKFHLEVRFYLTTSFLPHRGLAFYGSVVREIRERVGDARAGSLALKQPSLWAVGGEATLVHLHVKSWSASCRNQPNSVGTDLEMDGVLTCRGCSRKYLLSGGTCRPCLYGSFTRGPFYSFCRLCPPEEQWTNRQEMLDLCYFRP